MTVVILMAGLVVPMNLVQNLPPVLHLASAVFILWGVVCYVLSRRGLHLCGTYLLGAMVLLDVAWFGNGGSEGSIAFYFFPVILLGVVLLEGVHRTVVLGLILANSILLYAIEWKAPELIIPYASRWDRTIDLVTGVVAVAVVTIAIATVMLESYRRERQQLAAVAGRLRNSEEQLREIFDSTSDALFVHAPDGTVLDVNLQACAIFGGTREALLAGTFDHFSLGTEPYSRREAEARVARAAAGQSQLFEWHCRRANGELFWAEVALRGCQLGGERRVMASVRDISLRKRAEEESRRNEERLRLSMAATAQGWFELNVQTGVGTSSPEYARILGYDPETFRTTLAEWQAGIHPEDRERTVREFRDCVASGRIHTMEYRRQTKTGGWKWVRSVGKIVACDAAGKPLLMCGTHADVTERKELERQLMHSQRLEAVGTLASGVAHDLNNILTPIVMASGVLTGRLTDPRDRELMQMLDSGGRRGAAIVKQLLAFSRSQAQDRVPVDLWQLVRETLQILRSALPPKVIVVGPAPGRGAVHADSTQLHQVLMNLCVNARDAMPNGGTLTVGLTREQLPPGAPDEFGSAPGGPYLVLSVVDTGCGIPPEIRERIFDPFFTTKPGGTGLGLATVHGIVKSHRGFVQVESAVGGGTAFRVYLPEMAEWGDGEIGRQSGAKPLSAPLPGHRPCVLLVDDDPAVLLASRRCLEAGGFSVLPAKNGVHALRVLQEAGPRIGLVITDFSMPEMDGPTFVRKVREYSVSLPVVGISGNLGAEREEELRGLGFSDFLGKPFEPGELVAKACANLARAGLRGAGET
ncbi:MAG: PAS domain S-box protein [Verrucomicrobia bacterium]|nr:PAS domain S-box protein [Verrucomicrobiota bacterium]